MKTVLKTGGYLKGLLLDPKDVEAVVGIISRTTPICFTNYEKKFYTLECNVSELPEIQFYTDLKEQKEEPAPPPLVPLTEPTDNKF